MTLAVAPDQLDAFMALAEKRDVEATVVGTFTDHGALVVRHGARTVAHLDLAFLHDGCPGMTLEARWTPPQVPAPRAPRKGPRTSALRKLLGSLDICSREFKSRIYDAEVKGLSVVKPFVGVHADVPSDATVFRVEYDGDEGVVLSDGIHPFLSDLDTYPMMAGIIDLAVRRVVSTGGRLDRIAGLDNFCWPDPVLSGKTPDGPYKMAQLVRANKALYDVTTAYNVPCISGKDSMKNDSVRGGRKISIPPTVLFSTIGKIDDVQQAVTMDFKAAGDVVYVLGLTRSELGASAYHRWLACEQGEPAHIGGRPPSLAPDAALALYRAMNAATAAGVLRSSHTPAMGGLAVALALAALGGDLGAEIRLTDVPADEVLTDDELLFSESNSRFVVTCRPERCSELEAVFAGIPHARVGAVTAQPVLRIAGTGKRAAVEADLPSLRRAFKETLHGI